ncbi:GrpB family protein [Viridibacillus arvi]|uniref:GrpB family protein n=1 Tax=Viridibacillus arvi TaxID=263475 RepID=UPI00187B558D|nr:GrpB family protein [Viridibacillus sp. JNUCC-6]QOV12206.1 GrpB family protein [Viridibacillus sp. JNUCC-6]
MRKVEVVEYDQEWIALFDREQKMIRNILSEEIHDIFHIGSTSVENLPAKPVIDIMPVVYHVELVDQFNERLEEIGYVAKGEYGLPGRRYFTKGGDNRTHHLHFYEVGHEGITRHLAFRDYLRNHPAEATKYGRIKQANASQYPFNMEAYIQGKSSFASEIEQKALHWYENLK